MKNVIAIFALSVASLIAQAQTQVWKLDKSHSSIGFGIDHMVISETKGQFKGFTTDIKSDKADFTDAQVTITMDASTVNTEDEARDGHLKGKDFFDVEQYKNITFVAKSFKKVSGKNYKLTGELTMRGITKTVTLNAKFNGIIKSPFGDTRAGLLVFGEIDRYAFGMKYNSALETGGVAIGQKVRIACSLELIKG
jgi:polyisoprenoid-binding protein YceI